MAVVLNDLLGITNQGRTRRNEERIEQFPSYEEFWASRSEVGALKNDEYGYNENYQDDYRATESRANYRAAEDNGGYRAMNDYGYRAGENRNDFRQDYRVAENRNDFSQDYRAIDELNFGAQQFSSQARESEQDINYGGKRVSSPTQMNYRGVQAHTEKGDFNSCLYSVRNELSSVSDSQFEDSLYDKLAYISPLANTQQMRMSTRRNATEQIARKANKASRLTLKGKVILAIYIALAVLMTTLIAVNASGFNGMGHNAGAGNNVSYAETATEVETQATSTSAVVSNNETNFSYAKSEYNYAINSNWFDRFCDKFERLFD